MINLNLKQAQSEDAYFLQPPSFFSNDKTDPRFVCAKKSSSKIGDWRQSENNELLRDL